MDTNPETCNAHGRVIDAYLAHHLSPEEIADIRPGEDFCFPCCMVGSHCGGSSGRDCFGFERYRARVVAEQQAGTRPLPRPCGRTKAHEAGCCECHGYNP